MQVGSTIDASQGVMNSDHNKTHAAGASSVEGVVLLADDDQNARRICRDILASEGWQVNEATNGREALDACSQKLPDVVVMDVFSPIMNGLEVTRRLRDMPSGNSILIVMVTGETAETVITGGIEAGADAYIEKPIKAKQFVMQVNSLWRLKQDWRDLQKGRDLLGDHARTLSLLKDFGTALARVDDIQEIMDETIHYCSELTACRRISIMMPDASGENLKVVAGRGLDFEKLRHVSLPVGQSIAGRVFLNGSSICLSDQATANAILGESEARVLRDLPILSIPMFSSKRILGVLNLTSRVAQKPFQESETYFAGMFADFAAAAIDNMRARDARDEARIAIVIALAKLAEHRDNDTGRHVDRVTEYSRLLAEELKKRPQFASIVDQEFVRNLQHAAPLHDIGKVAVPDAILLKPGILTNEEIEVMKSHAVVGADTIRSVIEHSSNTGFLVMAEQIADSHHEWFDGSGYPKGLQGEQIPLPARILALADVYDALTSERVYKKKFSHRKALDIIREEAGTHFDPALAEAFLEIEHEIEVLAHKYSDQNALIEADNTPPAMASTISGAAEWEAIS